MNLEQLNSSRAIFVCGSGGVGKTSVSAALALHIARSRRRVLVITIDPARRLASALGLGATGNQVVQVPFDGLVDGRVDMSMLDTKQGWDELVARHAPDPVTRDKVLANNLYRNITERFVNSHDYIAIERLWSVIESGEYDTVVVDTPPSRNAIGVLDAPQRMCDFFASRLLRWLTVPSSSRLVGVASKPFFALADRVLGARFLSDIAEFFDLFRRMEPTFVAHAREVEAILDAGDTSYVVVTTAEPAPVAEAEYLESALGQRGHRTSVMIVNRVVAPQIRRAADRSRELLADDSSLVALDSSFVARMSGAVADVVVSIEEQGAQIDRLMSPTRETLVLPELTGAIQDLEGIRSLADEMGQTSSHGDTR
jgi:anion-transporting  ArsA/GET3 family ATPase